MSTAVSTEAFDLVMNLLTDLEAHKDQEGCPAEMRNLDTTWDDVSDRVEEIRKALDPNVWIVLDRASLGKAIELVWSNVKTTIKPVVDAARQAGLLEGTGL